MREPVPAARAQKRIPALVAVSITAFLAVLLVFVPARVRAGNRVLLVSWDGIRTSVLFELMNWQPDSDVPSPCPNRRHDPVSPEDAGKGFLSCLPNLARFQIINSCVLEGKPLTRPQHAQMLTGYGAAQTGVIANAGKKRVPRGLTLYERIDAARDDIITVHIGGRKYTGKGITRWAIKNEALDHFIRRGGRDRYTGTGTTEKAVEALDVIGDSPFFMFIHYKAADVLAHRGSHRSASYREAVIHNDVQLGALMKALEDRGLLDTTEILVTTDHGFEGIFHVNQSDPNITQTWIAAKSPILMPVDASVQDLVPTILDLLEISYENADPPYPGQSLLAGPMK